MKSATYPKRIFRALSEKSAFLVGVVVVATALCVAGCTSRKQYAINEAILISERRQLEDEIYRSKFELRDALRENQRLREQLEKEGLAGSSAGKKSNAEKKPTLDEDRLLLSMRYALYEDILQYEEYRENPHSRRDLLELAGAGVDDNVRDDADEDTVRD